ncbi:serine hydrolase family protein [Candidatus Peregrinibacteria bacterium]|nr:serine hydrolase family protein [Candidatus Peregrinibacteria bacterium]
MRNVFVFHGVGGYPEENWFPWLKKEVEKSGIKVFIPQFPTPEGQTLENWMQVLGQYDELNQDSIVIGHSLGVPFLLNVIENQPVKEAFLVSGFTGKADNDFDDSMKTFAQRIFNWEQIKRNCGRFCVFHSDNDPYIKIEKAKELSENLNSELIEVKGAGHFNAKSGYDTFDLLLERLNGVL